MILTYRYLYNFKYDYHHSGLSKLESRQIFDATHENKLLFSNAKVDPSISPFIKSRFEISCAAVSYDELLVQIEEENIQQEGFKVEYLTLHGDDTAYRDRLEKLRDIGHAIEGEPDYSKPSVIYTVCYFENTWYFGKLIKHNSDWQKHMQKPCSFSNSIGMNIGKTLVSIASKGNKGNCLLDACCGVGTVMLEACWAGFDIAGCDINWTACKHTRENLTHFNYTANVFCSDIKDLNQQYDAVIIDLPYNLYSYSDDSITLNIIESSVKLAGRLVIVSITDIEAIIKKSGLKVVDYCTVEKRGKTKFTRNIWVCEKE